MARVTAVLLLNDHPIGDRALTIAEEHLNVVQVLRTPRSLKFIMGSVLAPASLLLNFLSAPKVEQLNRFDLAINFHPAAPEYPGVGWASRSLYDKVANAGTTAHVMTDSYDAGPILAVRRFPVDPAWGYRALVDRAYEETLALFQECVECLSLQWAGKAMTRSQFELHPSFAEVKA